MVSYKVLVKKSAEKELRRLPPIHLRKVTERIKALSQDPRPTGVEMLIGGERYFRFRQGDYRVIYEVDDINHEVTIAKIGHRREIYR